ncbi:MAG: DUF2461 domain-containing protein [Bacteroidetes bacterium]|nr:DUF2461 domain-containing protein [Bacteroidota bacterium]
MKHLLTFLTSLSKNNNRDWFNAHKDEYEELKKQLETLSLSLITEIGRFDSSISHLQPKDTMFRIYRDIRFSKDKTPYKTNMGLFFVPGGKKSNKAGYYFHIEPGNSFVGGGSHVPQKDELKSIREEIYTHSAEFKRIVENESFVKTFGSLDGEKLSRPPKGFDPEFEDIEYLKHKSFTVFKKLEDDALLTEDLQHKVLEIFNEMKSFIFFLNRAIV